jgi:hypothetical protein
MMRTTPGFRPCPDATTPACSDLTLTSPNGGTHDMASAAKAYNIEPNHLSVDSLKVIDGNVH